MKLQEKIQYKVRNYLYQKDRERLHKKQFKSKGIPGVNPPNQKNEGGIAQFFEEIDEYLGEKVGNIVSKRE